MPRRISSPRIKKTFNAPAVATAANGTRRPNTVRVVGDILFNRGTNAFRPRATEHDAETASKYDLTIVAVDNGVDLFALDEFMATLRD